nr:Transposon Tn7 transposition protein TnsB [Plesiomonas shigelloides]
MIFIACFLNYFPHHESFGVGYWSYERHRSVGWLFVIFGD